MRIKARTSCTEPLAADVQGPFNICTYLLCCASFGCFPVDWTSKCLGYRTSFCNDGTSQK